MAKLGDTTFFGASRTVYKFGVFNHDSNFKDTVPAVYVLCTTNEKGQHKPVYVGETDKLGIEIPRRNVSSAAQDHGVMHICVHLDADEGSRRSKVSDLMAYYEPSGNSEKPFGAMSDRVAYSIPASACEQLSLVSHQR